MKFNPKPGDKIICKNGEEFTCCTLKFLRDKRLGAGVNDEGVTGYAVDPRNQTYGIQWLYWSRDGAAGEQEWNIKEIIPVLHEVKQDVTEVIPAQGDNTVGAVFQEKTYTLEQIKEAFDALQWYDTSFELLSNKLNEPQDPDYKLYLELKAKFEGKE